jgi:hypothetical protein
MNRSKTANDGPVQHDGAMPGTVFTHIFGVQTLGHEESQPESCRIATGDPIASFSVYSILGP